ncbi:MAG TPA: serine O-acetyltransferase [Burkholderiaceae bacterium]|nr:serine O-acetyltransferase [Burkholderiaceae bacterium]
MLVESSSTVFEAQIAPRAAAPEPHVSATPRVQRQPENWWAHVRRQARAAAAAEPLLRRMLDDAVLSQCTPAMAVSAILARRIGGGHPDVALQALLLEVLSEDRAVLPLLQADLAAVTARDPACRSSLHALLHLKGFHALQAHRVAHSLWSQSRHEAARWLASQVTMALAVDIHPAVPIGPSAMLDHATGIVVGETAVIERDVSILHGVTLGATGKQRGDRHPKVRRGVTLGAGATVLGNIEVGCMSTVGAGSVVVKPVPAYCTVAGVPARVVRAGRAGLNATSAAVWPDLHRAC